MRAWAGHARPYRVAFSRHRILAAARPDDLSSFTHSGLFSRARFTSMTRCFIIHGKEQVKLTAAAKWRARRRDGLNTRTSASTAQTASTNRHHAAVELPRQVRGAERHIDSQLARRQQQSYAEPRTRRPTFSSGARPKNCMPASTAKLEQAAIFSSSQSRSPQKAVSAYPAPSVTQRQSHPLPARQRTAA